MKTTLRIFCITFLLPLTSGISSLSAQSFNLVWSQTSNPSGFFEYSYAVTADASGIYVAGFDNSSGSEQWRIEKRNLNTGVLIASFGTGGVVTSNPSGSLDEAHAITADTSGIYVAGYDYVGGDRRWRIEKRNLTTGGIIWTQISDPSASDDEPYAITADASGIYVAGYDDVTGNFQWRIEKRDLVTGALIVGFGTGGVVTSNPSGSLDEAHAITADTSGIYVTGNDADKWRIEKRNLTTGTIIWTQISNPSANNDEAYAITVDASGVYVAGTERTNFFDSQWYIEKRDINTGNIFCTHKNNPSTENDIVYAISVDISGIYVVGSDRIPGPGDWEWRIEKYDGCGSFLPIELLSFTAQWLDVTQTDALLEWSTATEVNNSHFTIERSQDGINFTPLGDVPGAGNSSSTLYYQYIDNTLPEKTKADIFYYRLKQTDFDGQFTYSNIETLMRGSITVIGPVPNPIRDELNFPLVSAVQGEVSITITDVLGRKVNSRQYTVNKGIQQIKIPLHNLASAPYLLQVSTTDGAERIQKQFVVR